MTLFLPTDPIVVRAAFTVGDVEAAMVGADRFALQSWQRTYLMERYVTGFTDAARPR